MSKWKHLNSDKEFYTVILKDLCQCSEGFVKFNKSKLWKSIILGLTEENALLLHTCPCKAMFLLFECLHTPSIPFIPSQNIHLPHMVNDFCYYYLYFVIITTFVSTSEGRMAKYWL